MQEAGAAGRFADVIGWENFGKSPKEDRDNIQPRAGGVYDVLGDGRDVIRAGWGIYTDFGYTNSNVRTRSKGQLPAVRAIHRPTPRTAGDDADLGRLVA